MEMRIQEQISSYFDHISNLWFLVNKERIFINQPVKKVIALLRRPVLWMVRIDNIDGGNLFKRRRERNVRGGAADGIAWS